MKRTTFNLARALRTLEGEVLAVTEEGKLRHRFSTPKPIMLCQTNAINTQLLSFSNQLHWLQITARRGGFSVDMQINNGQKETLFFLS